MGDRMDGSICVLWISHKNWWRKPKNYKLSIENYHALISKQWDDCKLACGCCRVLNCKLTHINTTQSSLVYLLHNSVDTCLLLPEAWQQFIRQTLFYQSNICAYTFFFIKLQYDKEMRQKLPHQHTHSTIWIETVHWFCCGLTHFFSPLWTNPLFILVVYSLFSCWMQIWILYLHVLQAHRERC